MALWSSSARLPLPAIFGHHVVPQAVAPGNRAYKSWLCLSTVFIFLLTPANRRCKSGRASSSRAMNSWCSVVFHWYIRRRSFSLPPLHTTARRTHTPALPTTRHCTACTPHARTLRTLRCLPGTACRYTTARFSPCASPHPPAAPGVVVSAQQNAAYHNVIKWYLVYCVDLM